VQRSEGRIDRPIKVLKENRFSVQSVYRYVFSTAIIHIPVLVSDVQSGTHHLTCTMDSFLGHSPSSVSLLIFH
jgi:hypothetical protein